MSYLANYLDAIAALLRRYVVFRHEHQVTASAQFVAHTFAIEAADVTPYLIVTSAEKRSGKRRPACLRSSKYSSATPRS